MHEKIAIIGNSGSGKSTLANNLAAEANLPVLDLDTIAWEPNHIAVPRETDAQISDLTRFCNTNAKWIVEGCYASLIAATQMFKPYLIVLDPGVEQCIANCRSRPWEAHKYASKEEQDAKLEFLLEWVKDYYTRNDDMSLVSHRHVFDSYDGEKLWLQALPNEGLTLSLQKTD